MIFIEPYNIEGAVNNDSVDATVLGFALEGKLGETRRVWALPLAEGQLRWEFVGTLRFVVMAAFVFSGLLWVVPLAEEGRDQDRTVVLGDARALCRGEAAYPQRRH